MSRRIQKARCRRCGSMLAVHMGGIPGIPIGASFPWDEESDEFYSERKW